MQKKKSRGAITTPQATIKVTAAAKSYTVVKET